jgi:ribosomal subunit interface protein
MLLPVQVTFRDIPRSAAAEARVRARATRLERFASRITACRVALEAARRRPRHNASCCHVRIDLTVPGGELVVGRDSGERAVHRDLYAAIDHAFDVAQRRLEDHARRRRGEVKTHEPSPTAHVVRLARSKGFGFLETADGRELYFHHHSVLDNAFGRLQLGTEVRFVEEQGEKGPQASTVVSVGG